ncbi:MULTISPECIES: long-chain fatty acid--CoA ligase [unclassified Rathayibacter]|uniref:long-chain-fatty-acid--CoA ligase n=1 Tax=unclassified Rathayibacter TaxID=2609250 RepID=UPI000CE81676|nr:MULTISPECIES: long-chain fatty acid--CoA ligase [unclassified Rathayibacter]PPF17018.1 long-chain fatty acid--CoA ligase [Rathayibacter sp. AY1A7]PPH77849.1 long-chain fatty acid--CoA ligase [Rathayibacter sp. AY1D4]PPH86564.1 long-chain fatty acid--CoA ligase [Rathayibacter sp. AY1D3]QHC74390.1 AMP-binding protein [Rathayibacter sp. VKM Ac-2805]
MSITEPRTAEAPAAPPPAAGFGTLSVAAILAEAARRTPDTIAIRVGEQAVDYATLWRQTRAYAGALRAQGIGPGDRVALLVPNVPDFPRGYFAVLALGAVVVPVHALLKHDEIAYVLRDSGAVALVCAAPLLAEGAAGADLADVPVLSVMVPDGTASPLPRLEDLAAEATPIDGYVPRSPSDTATILYTSGTTGRPKGAEGTHFAIVSQSDVLLMNTFDLHRGDVVLGALPLFHTFGQVCAMNTAFRTAATVVLVPKFDGDAALEAMIAHGCTVFEGVPTMYVALLDAATRREDRPPLRYAVSGGAALPVAVIERFREVFGVEIYEGYGLTETSPVATFNHVGVPPRPGTVGTPIWGVEVEVARPDVTDRVELLPRGELGEIVVRGHNLMKGYLGNPAATAEAVIDGWFRTGDLGTKDEEDYVRILDRTKDMIIRNGYNVYPREVEEVLIGHPAVQNAAVFGIPDERHGQEVMAAVILAPSATATAEELIAYANEHLAAFKFPRRVEFVDALPLGPSGKILKRELVARYAG